MWTMTFSRYIQLSGFGCVMVVSQQIAFDMCMACRAVDVQGTDLVKRPSNGSGTKGCLRNN